MKPDSWWLDIKLGIRMLIRYPVMTLAAGCGMAVAVAIAVGGFSVVDRNFRPSSLPLEDGGRVVAIELWDSLANRTEPRVLYDAGIWRDALKSVDDISLFRNLTTNLIVPGAPPETIRVAALSASAFTVARVKPLLGRYLTTNDEIAGAPPVVVIGESVWRNRFAGDPAILGRSVQLGSTSHLIVGVMPKDFGFPVNHRFWVPLHAPATPSEPRSGPALAVFGRLAPGATLAGARAELSAVGARTARAFPDVYKSLRPLLVPYALALLDMHLAGDIAGIDFMQGLVLSLLVLVSLNVAILVYTRTAMRQEEIGLRTALGATRRRIVGQLFVEALVLSGLAALAGIAIAAFVLQQLEAATVQIAPDLPYWLSFRLSPLAVGYALVLGVVAAVIVGVLPGLQATACRVQTTLRIVGAGGSGLRFGLWTFLTVAQVGFAVAMLPPSVRSAWITVQAGLAKPGFAASEFLSAQLGIDAVRSAPGASGPDRFSIRYAELRRRLEAEPGIAGVTFSLTDPGDERGARIEAVGESRESVPVRFNRVDIRFFQVFEVPLLAGRSFEPGDAASGGPVLINDALARHLFPGGALGRTIRYTESPDPRWYEIVGVVTAFPTGVSPGMRDTEFKVYHAATPGDVQPATIALRIQGGNPLAFTRRLQDIALAVDPDLYLRDIRSLEEALRKEQWIIRLEAGVLLSITLSVLLLSSAGVYALMSFTVSQRRREIGIRIALGASRRRILLAVFSRALSQLAAGATAGALVGVAFTLGTGGPLLEDNAPAVLLAVVVLIVTVGFLAALGPTLRSLRIQPTDALRDQ